MAATATSLQDQRRQARTAPGVLEWLQGSGWHVVTGTAHRGVLHPDEYVSMARLVPAVERRLGFTVDELRWVYRGRGRRTAAQRMLRARIDARLLRLRDAGANMEILALVIGVDRKVIGRALARARQRKEA